MRYASGPRRELGLRTLFNILGPMSNPAQVKNQVIGVFSKQLCRPLAEVLLLWAVKHVGLCMPRWHDEISLGAPNFCR